MHEIESVVILFHHSCMYAHTAHSYLYQRFYSDNIPAV